MAWFIPAVVGAGLMAGGLAFLMGAKPAKRRKLIRQGEGFLERGERRLEKLEAAAVEPDRKPRPFASQAQKRREEGTIAGEREARTYIEWDPFAVERSYRRYGLDKAAEIEWKHAAAQSLDEVTRNDMKRMIRERARAEQWRTDVPARRAKPAPKARRSPVRKRGRR